VSEVGPRRPHLVGVPRRLVLAAVALVVVGPQTARPLPLFARAASRYSPWGADLRSPRPAARGRARRAPALLTGGRRRGALGARAVVGDAERYHHRRGPRPGRGPGQHRTGRVGVHRRGGPPGRTRPARTRVWSQEQASLADCLATVDGVVLAVGDRTRRARTLRCGSSTARGTGTGPSGPEPGSGSPPPAGRRACRAWL